ncbi:MAG: hypothetical protein AAF329_20880 [Cyanobacteria bacterium P01_A01_bin.17]
MQLIPRLALAATTTLAISLASLTLSEASYAKGTAPIESETELKQASTPLDSRFTRLWAGLDKAGEDVEEAADDAGDGIDTGAEATADTAEDVAEDTGEGIEDGAEATGEAVDDAVDATESAASDTGDAIGDAADDTGQFFKDLF